MIGFSQPDSFIFAPIPAEVEKWLRALPDLANAEDDAARARIFPSLTGGTDSSADAEWQETMEPELREYFRTHLDIVAADLAKLKDGGELGSVLIIPREHAAAWIRTLNQARLALGARHEITERDMNRRSARGLPREKARAIRQINLFGEMLGMILQETEL